MFRYEFSLISERCIEEQIWLNVYCGIASFCKTGYFVSHSDSTDYRFHSFKGKYYIHVTCTRNMILEPISSKLHLWDLLFLNGWCANSIWLVVSYTSEGDSSPSHHHTLCNAPVSMQREWIQHVHCIHKGHPFAKQPWKTPYFVMKSWNSVAIIRIFRYEMVYRIMGKAWIPPGIHIKQSLLQVVDTHLQECTCSTVSFFLHVLSFYYGQCKARWCRLMALSSFAK